MGNQQKERKEINVPINCGPEEDADTRAKMEQEKLRNGFSESCREVPSAEDVEANANIRPEVELMNSPSNGNEMRYNEKEKSLEDEACNQEKKAKVGRPRKGTRIASRRSACAQAHARE